MNTRENAIATLDKLIEQAVNLAESPHGKALDDYDFRCYFFKSASVLADWYKLQLDLFAVYLEARQELCERERTRE